jgi:hypothetical protein
MLLHVIAKDKKYVPYFTQNSKTTNFYSQNLLVMKPYSIYQNMLTTAMFKFEPATISMKSLKIQGAVPNSMYPNK